MGKGGTEVARRAVRWEACYIRQAWVKHVFPIHRQAKVVSLSLFQWEGRVEGAIERLTMCNLLEVRPDQKDCQHM